MNRSITSKAQTVEEYNESPPSSGKQKYSSNQPGPSCRLDEGVVWPMQGFSLLEIMIALLVLTAGLLSAGQVLFVAASPGSLSRSKGAAAIAAQDALESLTASFQQNPLAADLAIGRHGPRQTQVANGIDGSILNRFSITWDVRPVPDPRAGKTLDAKLVTMTVAPALAGGEMNSKPWMNKILNVSTILSERTQ